MNMPSKAVKSTNKEMGRIAVEEEAGVSGGVVEVVVEVVVSHEVRESTFSP